MEDNGILVKLSGNFGFMNILITVLAACFLHVFLVYMTKFYEQKKKPFHALLRRYEQVTKWEYWQHVRDVEHGRDLLK